MKIIVCVKVVFDPEAPASLFNVDAETKSVIPPKGTPPVLNPFDQNALEAALRIKDKQGCTITVISLGENIPKAVVRKCLAVGADNLILLDDIAFAELDSYSTASILSMAIRKIGEFDIILCGRQAADTDAGQVGIGIAELLQINCVNMATKVEVQDNKILKIERLTKNGLEDVETAVPALITASNEIGELRTATLPKIMAAQKKPVTVWNATELGIIDQIKNKVKKVDMIKPKRGVKCEIIKADSPENAAAFLAKRLREVKIL
jgi:electron transfer flavoprotein beta subunit